MNCQLELGAAQRRNVDDRAAQRLPQRDLCRVSNVGRVLAFEVLVRLVFYGEDDVGRYRSGYNIALSMEGYLCAALPAFGEKQKDFRRLNLPI